MLKFIRDIAIMFFLMALCIIDALYQDTWQMIASGIAALAVAGYVLYNVAVARY